MLGYDALTARASAMPEKERMTVRELLIAELIAENQALVDALDRGMAAYDVKPDAKLSGNQLRALVATAQSGLAPPAPVAEPPKAKLPEPTPEPKVQAPAPIAKK